MSDAQVRKATGRSMAEWQEELAAEGLTGAAEAEVLAYLAQRLRLPRVWAQIIAREQQSVAAAAPARERRGREPGLLEDAVELPAGIAWGRLSEAGFCSLWLGATRPVVLALGEQYELKDGTQVTVRGLDRPQLLCLDWKDPAWDAPARVSLELEPEGTQSTRLIVRLDGAPDEEEAAYVRGRLKRKLAVLVLGLERQLADGRP